MPKLPKMPKTVYAYYEAPNDSDPAYLVANETADACVDLSEKRVVGVYQLKEVIGVESETKITKRKSWRAGRR